MELETMEPNSMWDAEAHADVVEVLAVWGDEVTFKVWGGDWCKDCRALLPDFGAALEAAGVPGSRVEHYPVEKADDGSKTGPGIGEYGIEYIPTVVVERDGEELVRFVEDEGRPVAEYVAQELRERELPA